MRRRLHWRVQESTNSPTGVGSRRRMFKVLWNLECPVGLSQIENVRISVKEFWRKFDGPPNLLWLVTESLICALRRCWYPDANTVPISLQSHSVATQGHYKRRQSQGIL